MRAFLTICFLAGGVNAAEGMAYSEWNKLAGDQKASYTFGVVDSFSVVSKDDAQWRLDNREIINRCFVNKSINAGMVADQIDAFYAENIDKWEYSPAVAFLNRFLLAGGVCSREIEEVKGGQ
jgi:hypothetical protein